MRLGEYLHKTGMTPEQFAEAVEVSKQAIMSILYERGYAGAAMAKKIHLYTGGDVTVEELIFRRAGWERCPCCSNTLSQREKIDLDVLKFAREYRKSRDAKKVAENRGDEVHIEISA